MSARQLAQLFWLANSADIRANDRFRLAQRTGMLALHSRRLACRLSFHDAVRDNGDPHCLAATAFVMT